MYTRIVFCLCAVLIVLAATTEAQDRVPQVINFQGVLLDGLGNPITTPVSATFRIYHDSTGGTAILTETTTGSPDSQGRFSFYIDLRNNPPAILDTAYDKWLGITVGSDPEMVPRTRLGSAPYAIYAHGVHGDIQTWPGGLEASYVGPDSLKYPTVRIVATDSHGDKDSVSLSAGGGKAAVNMVATDAAGNKDSCTLTAGSGRAALALSDGAGYHSELTSNSLVMRDCDNGVPVKCDTGTVRITGDGNARFAGDVTFGWHGKDSLTYQNGILFVHDSAGNHSTLTSSSLSFVLDNDTLGHIDNAGNARFAGDVTFGWHGKDSLTYQNGMLTFQDTAGYHSELTSKSLSFMNENDTLCLIDNTGNAKFAGDIKSGNSLILQGNLYRLVTSNGKIYFGRDPGTGTFSDVQVGIGTQSPTATLQVEGTTNLNGVATLASGARLQAAANGGARILGEQGNTKERPAIGFFSTNGVDDGGGGNGIYRPGANAMAFAVQSSERMRITGWGIGIGSPPPTTPTSLLHVDGPISTAVATVTGNTTLSGYNSVVLGNNSFATGAITVTLPAANTCAGRQVTVKKISPLANGAVSVQRSGTDLIDGMSTQALNNQYDFFVLVSDGGSNWYIVGK